LEGGNSGKKHPRRSRGIEELGICTQERENWDDDEGEKRGVFVKVITRNRWERKASQSKSEEIERAGPERPLILR